MTDQQIKAFITQEVSRQLRGGQSHQSDDEAMTILTTQGIDAFAQYMKGKCHEARRKQ